jgi:cytochrome c-type biogenesis protein CcmH/NrfG
MPQSEAPANGSFQILPSPEVLQSMVAPMIAAVKADPKNAEAVIVLANFYYDHKMFTEAIKHYQRAIELDPKNVDVRTDLGTSYLYLDANDKAVAEFERALRIQPDYPQTLMNLGIARMERFKDKAGALKAWNHLLETNPTFPQKQQVLTLIAQAEKM